MDLQVMPVVPLGDPLPDEEQSNFVALVLITPCANLENTPWLGTSLSRFVDFLAQEDMKVLARL
eukprot:6325740-Amphidinium_carterae.2